MLGADNKNHSLIAFQVKVFGNPCIWTLKKASRFNLAMKNPTEANLLTVLTTEFKVFVGKVVYIECYWLLFKSVKPFHTVCTFPDILFVN